MSENINEVGRDREQIADNGRTETGTATQQQFAEALMWAICEYAEGGGPGRCDPEHCVCGAEGRGLADSLYRAGWRALLPAGGAHV